MGAACLGLFSLSAWAKPSWVVMPYLYQPTRNNLASNYANMPWNDLTHIADAFGVPQNNGTITNEAGAAFNSFTSLVTTAHSNNTYVMLSLGGAGGSWGFSAATSAGTVDGTVANIMAVVQAGAYDGVDIDWEFPSTGETAQWAAFMLKLSDALKNSANANYRGKAWDGTPKQLSFYLSPGSASCSLDLNNGAVQAAVDFAVMPGYDMNWGAGQQGPLDYTAADQNQTNACGWPIKVGIKGLFTFYTAGGAQRYAWPANKLVLGFPTYSISNAWQVWSAIIPGGTKLSYNATSAESTWTNGGTNYVMTDNQGICDKMSWALGAGLKGFSCWEWNYQTSSQGAALDAIATSLWNRLGGNEACPGGPTATRTFTPTATRSASPTASRTSTPANSSTFTATPSSTPTATSSSTLTATWTASSTKSATPANTPTFTASITRTGSPSATSTGTPSASPTPSPTASSTPTATRSPTPSPTLTATLSGTASATPTSSPSFTDVPVGSTPTFTLTASPTWTASPQDTASVTCSSTPSRTCSPPDTASATPSHTPTATSSPQNTSTASPTATLSRTPPTGTLTFTPSATSMPTTAPAGVSMDGPLVVREGAVLPNPVRSTHLRLQLYLEGASESLDFRVYSVAMQTVARGTSPGAAAPGWLQAGVDLPPGLATGIYYVEIQAKRGGQRSPRKVLKLHYLP